LDISVTTVSRAIDGYSDVADSTRALVIQTAKEMGYVPRHAARNLRLQRTNTIGLIFPTLGGRFTDPFFSEFLAGVGDEASQQKYDLLVSVASQGQTEEQTYRRWGASRRVDGFILVRMRVDDWRSKYLHSENIPYVAFGHNQSRDKQPWVGVDGRGGILMLVRHLIQMGHRRIAFIGAPERYYFAGDRLAGYQVGLKEAGIALKDDLICEADLTRSGGFQATQLLLDLETPPTAIIGVNDLTALGALRAVQERGMIVGQDIAIAGFDGTEAGEHSHPPLTTVDQPVYAIGRRVCGLLVKTMCGGIIQEYGITIQPELVIRSSTNFNFN
jgi:LacI family transcriptional regulator